MLAECNKLIIKCVLILGSSCFLFVLGAFLIPYFVMVLICGVPLLYMEFAIGQYTRLGPVHAFAKICPLFKGEWQSLALSRKFNEEFMYFSKFFFLKMFLA